MSSLNEKHGNNTLFEKDADHQPQCEDGMVFSKRLFYKSPNTLYKGPANVNAENQEIPKETRHGNILCCLPIIQVL